MIAEVMTKWLEVRGAICVDYYINVVICIGTTKVFCKIFSIELVDIKHYDHNKVTTTNRTQASDTKQVKEVFCVGALLLLLIAEGRAYYTGM